MLALATTDRAFAQTAEVEFNIPAQTVPAALNDFARQARLQLFFITEGFENVQANAVVGTYGRQEALTRLLAGTGLEASLSSDSGIKVKPATETTSSVSQSSKILTSGSEDISLDGMMAQATGEDSNVSVSQGEPVGSDGLFDEVREEIVVTGSRIRGAQSASPVVTITRQEIDQAGFATVEEVVENLPQNFGAGGTSDATQVDNKFQAVGGNIGNFGGGTSVNLRGLGASSTLVLLNGRRMSPGGSEAAFTNIASVPVTAIERVEVMTDGASAIYGSDAIGGVINFILRENYEGAETRLRYGSDAGSDTSNVQFGQSFGNAWDSGNVLLTYEYYDSDALASSDRKFTANNDLSPFGGTDWRRPGGNPANIVAGGQTFAIPAGQDGTALTSADFIGLENTQNLNNVREVQDVTPAVERHAGFLHMRQTVGAVELFGSARFSKEENTIRRPQAVVDFTVTGDDPATPDVVEGNPYFVDPTGTGLTTVRVDNYAPDDDFGPVRSLGEIKSTGANLGARFEFSDNWSGELTVNWSEEEAKSSFGNEIDATALRAAVNLPDPDLVFNPFGDGSNTNSAVIESMVNRRELDFVAENELWSASFNVNGDAFETSGGKVKVAAGIGFRDESLYSMKASVATATPTDLKRDILAVYAEVFLPLVSETNRRAGLQRLEVSLAARYEDYSDFGNSTNPKLGLLWSPTQSLNLRGTFGTSYRAPSLNNLDDGDAIWAYFPEGIGLPFAFLLQLGRNSELQAEEATTWTAGFQWSPESIDGLSLDVTYFEVDFSGRIEVPASNFGAAIVDPRFASIINTSPTGEQIIAFASHPNYDPDFLSFFGLGPFPAADLISGDLPVGAIFDNRVRNLADSVVAGAELQLSYSMETDLGSFNFGVNGSYLFDFKRRFIPSDPLADEVDTLGRPVDFRARGNVSWSRDRWAVTGFVNYMDGYTDQFSNPIRSVDSWTTVDLTIGYEIGDDEGLLSDIRLSLTTQNLFDENPPFVDTFGGVGYDATNASPLGQFFSLQVTKDW